MKHANRFSVAGQGPCHTLSDQIPSVFNGWNRILCLTLSIFVEQAKSANFEVVGNASL